jgi:hypothetical protein
MQNGDEDFKDFLSESDPSSSPLETLIDSLELKLDKLHDFLQTTLAASQCQNTNTKAEGTTKGLPDTFKDKLSPFLDFLIKDSTETLNMLDYLICQQFDNLKINDDLSDGNTL